MKKIFKIKPYEQGLQPKSKKNIKLNTNENLYHPNIFCLKNIIKEIKFFGNKLKFYPDSDSNIIKNQIKKYYNIEKKNIFIGNGSDDILSNVFLTFFKKKILYLIDITYSFYESFIKLYKINYKIIRINKNFSINIKNINNKKNNIIINNPNAPIGKNIENFNIKIISKNINLIVIDETYIDFSKKSFIKESLKKKNIIIVQTLSKSRSLAGIRVGFAISNKDIIKNIKMTKNSLNSYPVNILSQISLKNLFQNNIYFEKIKIKILENKFFLIKELKKNKFEIKNSETNFIFATNINININKLIKYLYEKNIFIRKFEIPKIENYIRITVGKKKDCEILLKNIKNFIKL